MEQLLAMIFGAVGQGTAMNQERKGLEGLQNSYERSLSRFSDIEIPNIPIEDQKLFLEMLASQGELTPEMLQALSLGPSEMENTFADQGAIDAQNLALEQMQEVATQGMTEADQAAAREIQRKTANDDMARRKAILNEMAMKGQGGSGAELAAQLDAIQQSEDNQAAANDKLLQQMQANRLNAIAQSGDAAGRLRQQDFGEKTSRSGAADAISKFNLQNKQRVMDTNVGNRNTAQQYNLDNKQKIADQNVGMKNAQQQYNKELQNKLAQEKFKNELERAKLIGNADVGAGQAGSDRAKATASGLKNLFGGGGSGLF